VNKSLELLFCSVLVLLIAAQPAPAKQSSELLTNASEVLSLSDERALSGIKVSIKGVVTAAESDWGGRFFVQDSSGGVFVENISDVQPAPGDVVVVSGITAPGGYAPIVSKPSWRTVGTAPLPEPKMVPIEQLMSGAEDSQRIQISGIVRNVQVYNSSRFQVELASGGYFINAFGPIPTGVDLQSLVGAEVTIKGTAATSFNAPLRHLIDVDVYVPFSRDFVVEKQPDPNPFGKPLTSINSIGQYHRGRPPGYRVHVRGVVTYQRKGEDVFIQDDTGGLEITSSQIISLAPGDVIDAVGFPGVRKFLPVLEDAVLRKTDKPRVVLQPKKTSIAELLEGLHHADFISLEGKLLDRLVEDAPSPNGGPDVTKTTLVLQNSNLLFTAEAETARPDPLLKSIPIGSTLKVIGICLLQSDEHGKIESFQMLLPAPSDVGIITKPSWLTAQHLMIILGIALLIIIVTASWIIMVSKRNVALRQLMHEREQDQKELQKAHDTLELRVKERTKQLKFQISARKEAEVQSKAILAERTRLAKELHDTLEQALTGVTLQLNTVAKLFKQDPDTANHHLGLVRRMVRTSQVDLRRSIWDLRSRELEKFDLSNALLISSNRIAECAGILVEVNTKGEMRPLPEIVEENLLRICQEAVTNTVKHSGARKVEIELEFNAESIELEIKDDGKGFTPGHCAGPNDGHFGLLGMSERAKRLGGSIAVTSAPGEGTAVCVKLPIEQTPVPQLANEQAIDEENITDPDFDS
jgi:signal transduction histidine kinase